MDGDDDDDDDDDDDSATGNIASNTTVTSARKHQSSSLFCPSSRPIYTAFTLSSFLDFLLSRRFFCIFKVFSTQVTCF